ncbi:unnamed protein product [Caenorhabditis auriculariae]|uniref:Uncharacterized protein n=1 Tax=Caenorhabditis auriculariae TaxID=2777116 RepID=A0A8S1GNG3_9PELO|nr:unnamed protein product [Caenorhabditis auriculariae]
MRSLLLPTAAWEWESAVPPLLTLLAATQHARDALVQQSVLSSFQLSLLGYSRLPIVPSLLPLLVSKKTSVYWRGKHIWYWANTCEATVFSPTAAARWFVRFEKKRGDGDDCCRTAVVSDWLSQCCFELTIGLIGTAYTRGFFRCRREATSHPRERPGCLRASATKTVEWAAERLSPQRQWDYSEPHVRQMLLRTVVDVFGALLSVIHLRVKFFGKDIRKENVG